MTMAKLTKKSRQAYFKYLGLGEYNKANILKFQKKYFTRAKDHDGKYGVNTDRLLRHVYNVTKYTKNFKPEEFKCGCGGKYCTGYPSYMKKTELVNLQTIRTHYGKSMTITSGLRCRKFNSKLSGSSTESAHLTGYAADYYIAGVTDTLANRKKAIEYIRKLPAHHWTYGNGWCSKLYAVNAPNMGNAMHTDSLKATASTIKLATLASAVKVSNASKLNSTAIALAWPKGTKKSKYHYPKGSATPAFKKALNKAYPNRKKWNKKSKKGVACDVAVGTVVRASGVDKKFPRGYTEQLPYMKKSKKWKKVKYTYKKSQIRGGDIFHYKGHVCMAVNINGKPYLYEAQLHKENYAHISSIKKVLKKHSKMHVYRAK